MERTRYALVLLAEPRCRLGYMADSADSLDAPSTNSTVDELIRSGRLRPAKRRLEAVLNERGPLTGPRSDAGTRAVEEERRERRLTADDG